MIREAPIEHDGKRYVVLFEEYVLTDTARSRKGMTRTIFSLREVVGKEHAVVACGDWAPWAGCHNIEPWVPVEAELLKLCSAAHKSSVPVEMSLAMCCSGETNDLCATCIKARNYERQDKPRKQQTEDVWEDM